jgi:hypothetical protein
MYANRLLLTLASLCMTALVAYSPNVQAACSCLCIDAAPSWECSADTLFVSPEPADCQLMQCQPLEEPVVDTTPEPTVDTPPAQETGTGGTDVADSGSDAGSTADQGLSCKYRNLYRPDLGKYKKVKVCRLNSEQRQQLRERMAAFKENRAEAVAEYKDHMSRLKAKHKERMKHHREHSNYGKYGTYGKYGKHTGD